MMTVAQVDVSDSLDRAWDSVVEVVPKVLLFLVILVAGLIIARVAAGLLDKILERVGFDRWVERGGIQRVLSGTHLDASDMLSKLVYYALVLLTLQLAFGVFGDNPISDLIESIVAYLPNIFVAILIIVVAAYLARAVKDIAQNALAGFEYGSALATAAYVAVLVIGVFAALDQLEIAPNIINGLFYAILAVIAGSLIIAVGGGGIQPMRTRWERWLGRVEEQTRLTTGNHESAPAFPHADRSPAEEDTAIIDPRNDPGPR